MKMPFGKYGPKNFPPQGVELCFINSGYLKWLLEQDWFLEKKYETTTLAVEVELKLRDLDSSHFQQDKVMKK